LREVRESTVEETLYHESVGYDLPLMVTVFCALGVGDTRDSATEEEASLSQTFEYQRRAGLNTCVLCRIANLVSSIWSTKIPSSEGLA